MTPSGIQELRDLADQLEQEHTRLSVLMARLASLFECLDTLQADRHGDERFYRKLRGHCFGARVAYVCCRDGCSEQEAVERVGEGKT